ncbi:TIGR03016 family PEP-CTERM system-associated outer membrane protein [Roseateles saccharophilus]|nr:TIGR03016 family PEP-CTERM system-associated outer membrane protein [Roseateles saccharophilus]
MAAMTRRRAESLRWAPALVLALAAGGAARAQTEGAATGGGMTVRPRIAMMETWTDNLRLSEHDKDAALVTVVSPGISIVRTNGPLRGSLDYTLNGIVYEKSDQPSQLQSALQANGQAELIERHLLVDMNASIGQQSASAFGLQSTPTLGSQSSVSTLANANRHQVSTLLLSPMLHEVIGSLVSMDLRGNFSRTEVRGSSLGDNRGAGGSLRFTGAGGGSLNWWTQVTTQQTTPASGRANRLSSAVLGLSYQPDADLTLGADAGRERNDYLTSTGQKGNTGGVNAQWRPTPRTRVNGDWHRHEYGNSHSFSFEHRMAHSVWQLSDSQAVTVGSLSAGGVRSNYDQFFLLFASLEPDPVKRDLLVRAYLQAQGLSPDAPSSAGFLSSGPSQLRSQTLGFTLQGVRSTLSAQASRNITRRLGSGLNQGDLANNSRIEQRSYSLTASHQLTPTSGLSVTAAHQQALGDASGRATRLTSLTANWNGKLGPRSSVQFGARHARFEGVTAYAENAVYANLTQQF